MFRIGDLVRRKVEHQQDWWNELVEGGTLFKVDRLSCYGKVVGFEELPDLYDSYKFELYTVSVPKPLKEWM